jgi:hypothetical protein
LWVAFEDWLVMSLWMAMSAVRMATRAANGSAGG